MSTEKEDIAAKRIIDEIYAVREKIYEKIKDMSPEEQSAYFNNSVEEIEAERGVRFKRAPFSQEPVLAER